MNVYYISAHVHFACEGDTVIFLDVRADRYSMLVGSEARAFKTLLSRPLGHHRRVLVIDESACPREQELRKKVITKLLENRLATVDETAAEAPFPADISLPERNLLDPKDRRITGISIRDVANFLLSAFLSRLRLKYTKLETLILKIERRRRLNATSLPIGRCELCRLVSIYNRLRPMLPWDHVCLLDSLCLLEFLARYRVFPALVFAVRLDPWAAHCWVQHDASILNEDVDEARAYLPIMAV